MRLTAHLKERACRDSLLDIYEKRHTELKLKTTGYITFSANSLFLYMFSSATSAEEILTCFTYFMSLSSSRVADMIQQLLLLLYTTFYCISRSL